ncbi:MAG TPA: HAMP domain-containing sensor histidine kinase [Baekduia sp.]|uniref:sensor histidine kinase n=1 Tax=Baekduia sp. TaxID=2600305 RepID=UPI002BB4F588|nr:HAMP domain-containing sensor histidine kinase [Baekduia sp.]HMJ32594.1 HAMP domain-containing sensor histidine kinase [Baekduia sp.]
MSLRLLLALTSAYVVLLAVVALEVPLGIALRDRVDAEVRQQASAQAAIVAATAADLLTPAHRAQLQAVVDRTAAATRGRVLVVDRRGIVLADSAGPAMRGESYASRPEIATALTGRSVQNIRRSETLAEDLLTTSAPTVQRGRPSGAVRITQSVRAVDRAVHRSWVALALLGLLVLGLAAIVGALVAQRVARPVSRLERAAEQVAAGDLSVMAAVDGTREQRSLARSFNEMTARLARLLRSHQDFVADASHQLRTPLTALRLRLEEADAALDGGDPAVVREELRAATGEAHRLTRIVEELLILTRAPGMRPPAEAIELGTSAHEAVERWAPSAATRGIELTAVPCAPGRVHAARGDVDRVLDALIENAIAYSPAGTTVAVVAEAAAIHVDDEGPGLAEGEAEAVFERFRRGRTGRGTPGGSGLGLAIARELAGRWNATVALTPRTAGGTRATVGFAPATAAPRPAAGAGAETARRTA